MGMGFTVNEPLAYRFRNDDCRQIAIAVRGRRPCHILTESDEAEKDHLDHQFRFLVNATVMNVVQLSLNRITVFLPKIEWTS